MGPFYMYSYGIRNNTSPASADATLSCKPVRPVTRGGCGSTCSADGNLEPLSDGNLENISKSFLKYVEGS